MGTAMDRADPRAFALIAEVNAQRGPVDQSQVESSGSEGRLEMHASYWIGELPDDGLLTLSVVWPLVGLPSTTPCSSWATSPSSTTASSRCGR